MLRHLLKHLLLPQKLPQLLLRVARLHLRLLVAHVLVTTPLLLHRAWVLAPRVLHVPVTTPLLLHRAWEPAPRVHQAPAAFPAPWRHVPVVCLVPAVPVVQVVPVAQVAQVVQELVSSAQVVLVAVSVPVVLVELVQVLEQALPHVPVLVLTVPPQVAVAAVAVDPAVEPLVHSVVAAESPRHVSRRERKEQSLNSARHLRLVA